MLMNYILQQSRDHTDSEYVSHVGVERNGASSLLVTNKFTYIHNIY